MKNDTLKVFIKTERESSPLCLNTGRPEFTWKIESGRRGCLQKYYRITVTDDHGKILWDSGRQQSRKMAARYNGSDDIPPETTCIVRLEIEDNIGDLAFTEQLFRTGLMTDKFTDPVWCGAKWIGTGTLNLYANALSVFKISAEFCIESGSDKAGIILGADDPRIMDKNKNTMGVNALKGESYVLLCLDISGLRAGSEASVLVYRAGYTKNDDANVQLFAISVPKNIISTDNCHKWHTLSADFVYGEADIYLDGEKITKPADDAPPWDSGKVNLNPAGKGGNYICYPNLCHTGVYVPAGQSVSFRNFEVRNFRIPCNVLFSMFSREEKFEAGEKDLLKIEDPSHGGLPMVRCEFTAENIKRAYLTITSRGIYEAWMNGKRVGDDYFTPGLTQYNITHMYQVYDVTDKIQEGKNALGIILGEGWWSGSISFTGENWNFFGDRSCVIAKLSIEDFSGKVQTIVTGPDSFTASDRGPHRYASLFQGHVYDSSLLKDISGWTEAGFAGKWDAATEVPIDDRSCAVGHIEAKDEMTDAQDMNYDNQKCMGQIGNSVKLIRRITAQSVREIRAGIFIYDFGQNIAGTVEIKIPNGENGRKIILRYAEICYPELEEYGENQGMIMTENLRAAMATDVIFAGSEGFLYTPKFTFHGFRYLEVTGLSDAPDTGDVYALAFSSVKEITADYKCSDEKINRLFENICWSLRDNFLSIPTDCPQRNERMGWSGDLSVFSRTAVYLCDADAFLRRHMISLRDMQKENGMFPDIAPVTNGFGGILWGSVGMTAVWEAYMQYDDTGILRDNYDAMTRYISYLEERVDERGLQTAGLLGDWLGPQLKRTENKLLWTAYYIFDLEIMAKTAEILGRGEADIYLRMWRQSRSTFNKIYFDSETHKTVYSEKKAAYGNLMPFETIDETMTLPEREPGGGYVMDTQTSYCVPLALNIVEDEHIDAAYRHLARVCSTAEENDSGVFCPPYSLMTGFIGTAWILPALSQGGNSNVAYRMLRNTSYPSWLYPVEQGATTIWERLDSYTLERGFGGNNSMNSFNHYSFGAVGQWMISYSLGIKRNKPGFKSFILEPQPDEDGGISHAYGYCITAAGRIESGWEKTNDGMRYTFVVPANTDCAVVLRLKPESVILESGNPVEKAQGVKLLQRTDTIVSCSLSPGKYEFHIKQQ